MPLFETHLLSYHSMVWWSSLSTVFWSLLLVCLFIFVCLLNPCKNAHLLFCLELHFHRVQTFLHRHIYFADVQVCMTVSCSSVGIFDFFIYIHSFIIPSSWSLDPNKFSIKKYVDSFFPPFDSQYYYPMPGFYDVHT